MPREAALISLGPFDLYAPIGRGGTSEIWSAVHRDQRLPVAVKFLTARKSRNPAFRAVFQNEVRATAALDHPHIVMLFDFGEVTPLVAAMSEGRLLAGTPFLAMELLRGGTLEPLRGKLPWPELLDVMLSLLDALAHAHARGVIHRDIKPGNVLLWRPDSDIAQSRPRWVKLTDFGLAHALGDESRGNDPRNFAGTPAYMAPEQIQGRWHDYGPWTDLYSFGCLVYFLVCGRPPFGLSPTDARRQTAHLTDPVPPLRPVVPVPPGFEDWVLRLLAKAPEHRFQRAADAAWALLQLGSPTDDFEPVALEPLSEDDVMTLTATAFLTSADLSDLRDRPVLAGEPPSGPDGSPPVDLPPFPSTWRRPEPPRPSLQLQGAGLGLYGMRTIPLVGREAIRDALWDATWAVRNQRRARIVVLESSSGCGASRVAEWLGERAHECGTSEVLKVVHSPFGGPGTGLGGALRRFFAAEGATLADVMRRIEGWQRAHGLDDPDEVHALATLVVPSDDDSAADTRTPTQEERFTTWIQWLHLWSKARPGILWFDDVHWSLESIQFAQFLLRRQPVGRVPVLVVMTVNADIRLDRAIEGQALDDLLQSGHASGLRVEPLDRDEANAMVRHLLALEPPLVERVAEVTGGNPSFAVQLVGDWVQRGLLVQGREGFQLRPTATVEIPDSLHAVWQGRVIRVLDGRSDPEAAALELAAVLGPRVDGGEWARACAACGARPTQKMVEAMLQFGLATCNEVSPRIGWSFAHAMVRESIERIARDGGRLAKHHRVVAEVLAASADEERVARHWLAGGAFEQALEPLHRAAQRRYDSGEYDQCNHLLDDSTDALTAIDPGRSDPRWAIDWILRARVSAQRGQWDEAEEWLAFAEQRAKGNRYEAQAAYRRGEIERQHGRLENAREALERAIRLADASLATSVRLELARVLGHLGEAARAIELVRQCLSEFSERGDGAGVAAALKDLGLYALTRNDLPEAWSLLRRAHEQFEKEGLRWGSAAALNSLGDCARYQGNLDVAAQLYRQAGDTWRRIGSTTESTARHNLGLVLLERGAFDEATEVFAELVPTLEARGESLLLADARLAASTCAAAMSDWVGFDAHLDAASRLYNTTQVVDEDSARLAMLTAEIVRASGQATRAVRIYRVAMRQWERLGREAELTLTRQALASLGAS